MKQKILEKLFNDEPLSSEEILYVKNNLNENVQVAEVKKTRRKKGNLLPFNHENSESLKEACGLTSEDFVAINKIITERIVNKKDEVNTDSKHIEVMEMIANESPVNLRLILYNYVRNNKRDFSSSLGRMPFKMGGNRGGSDDFNDFLDFLKSQGGR